MTTTDSTRSVSTLNAWVTVSLALLAGIIVLGTGVYFVTVLETPIGPPVETAPLFVWTTTAAVMAFVLLGRGHALGYAMALLAAILAVTTVALVGSGAYGEVGASSSPLGPLSYVAMALALVATTLAAWRGRSTAADTRDGLTTSR